MCQLKIFLRYDYCGKVKHLWCNVRYVCDMISMRYLVVFSSFCFLLTSLITFQVACILHVLCSHGTFFFLQFFSLSILPSQSQRLQGCFLNILLYKLPYNNIASTEVVSKAFFHLSDSQPFLFWSAKPAQVLFYLLVWNECTISEPFFSCHMVKEFNCSGLPREVTNVSVCWLLLTKNLLYRIFFASYGYYAGVQALASFQLASELTSSLFRSGVQRENVMCFCWKQNNTSLRTTW